MGNLTDIRVPETGLYRVEAVVLVAGLANDGRADLSLQVAQDGVTFGTEVTSRVYGAPEQFATHTIATTVRLQANGLMRFVCQGNDIHEVYGGGSNAFTTLSVTKVP